MRCTRCLSENRDEHRYCVSCGAYLGRQCRSCGYANEPAARFCGQCGTTLDSGELGTEGPVAEASVPPPRTREGERKLVTVLFADLKGSLSIVADRDPEDARNLLDDVLVRLIDAVHDYGGTVNQISGA